MSGRGGARANSGPPPDPNALRRERDNAEWRHLPAAGREGETPEWPLTRASAREQVVWAQEWKRPQAIVWEENGQQREVALYVRALAEAEKPKAYVATRTLVRQLMDDLGVSLVGMRRHRWLIDSQPLQEKSTAHESGSSRRAAKDRFKVIEGRAAS